MAVSFARQNLALAVNAACLVVALFVGWQVSDLRSQHLVVLEEYIMQTFSTTWTSGGSEHTVTTPRLEGESTADWIARHRDAVTVAQQIFPADS